MSLQMKPRTFLQRRIRLQHELFYDDTYLSGVSCKAYEVEL